MEAVCPILLIAKLSSLFSNLVRFMAHLA